MMAWAADERHDANSSRTHTSLDRIGKLLEESKAAMEKLKERNQRELVERGKETEGALYAFLGVRGSPLDDVPDMEIVTDYRGSQRDRHGQVELFFREARYAGYDVLATVEHRLKELNVPHETNRNAAGFTGGDGQIFLTQEACRALCGTAAAWSCVS